MIVTKNCIACGGEFTAPYKHAKFCSMDCRSNADPVKASAVLDRIVSGFCDGRPEMMAEFRKALDDVRDRRTIGEIRHGSYAAGKVG